MQTYECPQCGQVSSYDPWTESAHCPQCGHTPDRGIPIRGRLSKKRTDAHQAFLDELQAHWEGTHHPDSTFTLKTLDVAVLFFQDYQRAMGEDPFLGSGGHVRYIRSYHPNKAEILSFVGAYLLLRRGMPQQAARKLADLCYVAPEFVDAWIWRTATTDDPAERREFLENALLNDPAHPLARDAMALLRGVLDKAASQQSATALPRIQSIRCPNCGGSLHYRAGAGEVSCPHCGHQIPLERRDILDEEAPLLDDLQIRRRYQRHVWREVERVMRCASCAGRLVMTEHLARRCPFCASTNVLVEDNRVQLQQPDGFLPFEVDERQAQEAVQHHLQMGLRKLKRWWSGEESKLGPIGGIYIPFWVFDGFVEVRAWQSSLADPTPAGGGTDLSDQIMLDNLLLPGVTYPDPALLEKLLPYEAEDMVPYEPRLLANWPAAIYQRDVELAVEDAYDTMIARAQMMAPPLVPPEAHQQHPSLPRPTAYRRSFQVSTMSYQMVLVPVWSQIVQEGNQQRLALVNGQTGKVALGEKGRPEQGG